ncbi:MAG: LysE family transporter [Pseudomonadota bacterium]
METLTAAHLLAFNVALFFAVAAPGPAFLVCTEASLSNGRRAGVLTGLGLAVMAGLWTLAALLGLEALFDVVPAAYTALKFGGALLVLFFAVQSWRSASSPIGPIVEISKRRSFAKGFLLNLGNPKSILFAAGVLLLIFPPGLSWLEIALITVNHVLLEILVYSTLATILSRDAVRQRYLTFKPAIARVMAVVLGALGLRLLVTS